jgi:hypothetical protein
MMPSEHVSKQQLIDMFELVGIKIKYLYDVRKDFCCFSYPKEIFTERVFDCIINFGFKDFGIQSLENTFKINLNSICRKCKHYA